MSTMIDTAVIGAGQAGLATSHWLTAHGRDHVVFERGRIGERWRSETWDSLHLLTPNWANQLPGSSYGGPDPDGFMAAGEFARRLDSYARLVDAPVVDHTAVEVLRRRGDLFELVTDSGCWRATNVVIATGWCDRPAVPGIAEGLGPGIDQVVPAAYRNPAELGDGGVLVVGASATGVQIADELRASGRDVTLAVGSHTRMPRRYRGMDAFWWLERVGLLDKTIDEMPDAHRARHEPSLQLVGRPDHRRLDLATLRAAGVKLTGRLVAVDGHRVDFATDLVATVAAAETRLHRVLHRIDTYIERAGLAAEVLPPDPPPPVTVTDEVASLDLRAAGISTVVWATGHRRSYGWLELPVLDRHGELRQRRGVTPMPGLYVVGQRFQHHRSSNFIGWVGRDAAFVVDHLARRGARRPLAVDTH